MNSLQESRGRVELMLESSSKKPCEGRHALELLPQCCDNFRETVLYCMHGHDRAIHEYIDQLRAVGDITDDEAKNKHEELVIASDELHKKDEVAEEVGQFSEDDDEIASTKSDILELQLAAIRKKVAIIHWLQTQDSKRLS